MGPAFLSVRPNPLAAATLGPRPVSSVAVSAHELHALATALFLTQGVSKAVAHQVVSQLIDANLTGHDSHGILRVVRYLDDIKTGQINLQGKITVAPESNASMTIIDGGWQFGQLVGDFLVEQAIEKARGGAHTLAFRESPHIGRLSWYADTLARQDFFVIMIAGVFGAARVAYPNGVQGKMGTNPICIAVPRPGHEPLVVDMGTAYVEGKVRVAYENGYEVEPGLLIDDKGNPTRDPACLYEAPYGALLPLGGSQEHKGGALAFMIEILGATVSGSYLTKKKVRPGTNSGVLIAIDKRPLAEGRENDYGPWLEARIEDICTSIVRDEGRKIVMPGQKENELRRERLEHGIPVTVKEWKVFSTTARERDIDISVVAPDAARRFSNLVPADA